MKEGKKVLWVIVVIVAIVVVYWGFSYKDLIKDKAGTLASPTPTPTPAIRALGTPEPQVPTLSYEDALRQYGDRRIQFDENCSATPGSFSISNNSRVMLDNRSNQTRQITVDGTAYSLPGFGFRIVTLSSQTIPKTISVNCNGVVNAVEIRLQ